MEINKKFKFLLQNILNQILSVNSKNVYNPNSHFGFIDNFTE